MIAPDVREASGPLAGVEGMRRRVRAMIIRLLRLAFAASLLYYAITQIGVASILDRAAAADSLDLALAFGIFLAVHWLASVRLKQLMDAQQVEMPVAVIFEVNLAARFYGLFLPAGNLAAALIRMYKFARGGVALSAIATALFADRMLATLALCVVGLSFWLPSDAGGAWLAAFVAAFCACLLPVGALFTHKFLFMPKRLADFLRTLMPKFWGKLDVALQRSRLNGRQVMLESFALSVAAHLVGTIGYWVIAQSLDLGLSLVVIGWIRAAMMLATLLPITVSGLGVRELASLSLLGHYGIEGDSAIAFSLLVFGVMVVGVGLLGGLAEAWRFVRR